MGDVLFDLNVDKILPEWGVSHALRELIANAIDEQILTHTADIQVEFHEPSTVVIRDFGRGIRKEAFVLCEDEEKMTSKSVIGRFGFGLKDAVATLFRHNVDNNEIVTHQISTATPPYRDSARSGENRRSLVANVGWCVRSPVTRCEVVA